MVKLLASLLPEPDLPWEDAPVCVKNDEYPRTSGRLFNQSIRLPETLRQNKLRLILFAANRVEISAQSRKTALCRISADAESDPSEPYDQVAEIFAAGGRARKTGPPPPDRRKRAGKNPPRRTAAAGFLIIQGGGKAAAGKDWAGDEGSSDARRQA